MSIFFYQNSKTERIDGLNEQNYRYLHVNSIKVTLIQLCNLLLAIAIL